MCAYMNEAFDVQVGKVRLLHYCTRKKEADGTGVQYVSPPPSLHLLSDGLKNNGLDRAFARPFYYSGTSGRLYRYSTTTYVCCVVCHMKKEPKESC